MTDLPLPRWNGTCRRVIPAAGAPHRGPVGFTILVVRKRDGQFALDPHTVGARMITIGEGGARALRVALIARLG
ncbi:MAG: hypothetical protein ACRDRW_14555 [Pseudonocardiaceae bacterium]